MNSRSDYGDPQIKPPARHTLFFVPMEYWGPIFLAVGITIALFPSKP
jgi:hypothetical protein